MQRAKGFGCIYYQPLPVLSSSKQASLMACGDRERAMIIAAIDVFQQTKVALLSAPPIFAEFVPCGVVV